MRQAMIRRKQISVTAACVVCDRCGAESSSIPFADDAVAVETAENEGFVCLSSTGSVATSKKDLCLKCAEMKKR